MIVKKAYTKIIIYYLLINNSFLLGYSWVIEFDMYVKCFLNFFKFTIKNVLYFCKVMLYLINVDIPC